MFKVNEEYDRNDLLSFTGSKQQISGIIYGPLQPNSVIITSGGKHGESFNYSDHKNKDGTWRYIGQGSTGNQKPLSAANSKLTNQNRDILLFSTREPNKFEKKQRGNQRKRYKFEGLFNVLQWDLEVAADGERRGDKLVVITLIPANNIFDDYELANISLQNPPKTLESLYLEIKQENKNRPKGISKREYIQRSDKVKEYAILRANGLCELCNKTAPFLTSNGIPFLEVHHIMKLADDGPDEPENVAALCPNCHRESHFGENQTLIKDKLISQFLSSQLV